VPILERFNSGDFTIMQPALPCPHALCFLMTGVMAAKCGAEEQVIPDFDF
jgi:hypothetical protein